MFARAVNIQFQSGKVDEASHIVQDSIVPILKKQKGFQSQLLLTQRDTGKAISINLWETEEDLTAFEAGPLYRELMSKLGGVLAGPPAGERYEVVVQA
jgi:heme-degrading monooxygenase HmoA